MLRQLRHIFVMPPVFMTGTRVWGYYSYMAYHAGCRLAGMDRSSMVVDSPWDTWPRRVRGNEAYRTGKEGAALQQHSYKSKNRQPPLCTIYNPGCRHRYSSIRGGDPPLTAASG